MRLEASAAEAGGVVPPSARSRRLFVPRNSRVPVGTLPGTARY